jgi:hypothetical protein
MRRDLALVAAILLTGAPVMAAATRIVLVRDAAVTIRRQFPQSDR